MSSDLDAAKQRVKSRILGRAGVHGIGVRKGAVAVYLDRDAAPLPDEETTALEQAAAPFSIVIIREDRASAFPSA